MLRVMILSLSVLFSCAVTADDWIDYMHLYKNENNDGKIINVLWQYRDTPKNSRKP